MSRHGLTPQQESSYLAFDPFLDCDRDVKIRARKARIVRTTKEHYCVTPEDSHKMPAGTLARKESAVVVGIGRGSYYTCLACCDLLIRYPDPATRPAVSPTTEATK